MSTHTPFAEPGAASAFAPRDALLQGHDTTFATEADAQCGYSSARGLCLMIAQPGFSFCSIHLCPHGCGRKKGSRDADCGQPHNAPAPRKFMSLVDQANTVKTVLGLHPGMPVAATVAAANQLVGLESTGTLPAQLAALMAMLAPAPNGDDSMDGGDEGAGGSYQVVSPDTVDQDLATNVDAKAAKLRAICETRAIWFQHSLSRQQAEALLANKGDGKFVVRKSSMDGFYSLSVGTNGGTGFWHGLIRYNANSTFDMQGHDPWFTLDDLIYTLMTELQDQNNKAMPPLLLMA